MVEGLSCIVLLCFLHTIYALAWSLPMLYKFFGIWNEHGNLSPMWLHIQLQFVTMWNPPNINQSTQIHSHFQLEYHFPFEIGWQGKQRAKEIELNVPPPMFFFFGGSGLFYLFRKSRARPFSLRAGFSSLLRVIFAVIVFVWLSVCLLKLTIFVVSVFVWLSVCFCHLTTDCCWTLVYSCWTCVQYIFVFFLLLTLWANMKRRSSWHQW